MRSFVALAVVALLLPLSPSRADEVTGTPGAAQPVGSMSWSDMLRHDAERAEQPRPEVIPAPHLALPLGHDILVGPPAPESHAPAPIRAPADRGGCVGLSGPTLTDSFLAIEDENFTIPPDTMGAVGPTHVMTMLNDRVRIQDRMGGIISTVFLPTFWAPASPTNPFDPSIIYDDLAGRFIACCASSRRSASSAILFAISRTSDPTGVWDFYSFDADPTNIGWCDFPRLGYNGTWIAITGDMFTVAAGDNFLGVSMWVLDASTALVAGGPVTFNRFDYGFDVAGGVFGVPLVPACTHDPGPTTLWIIDSTGFSSGGSLLQRISRITGTGASPVWSVATGSLFTGTGLFFVPIDFNLVTPDIEQLGTATRIASNDSRVLDAEVRNGALWYTHEGGLPAANPVRTSSFWYQIDPTALPSPVVQAGVVDTVGAYHVFPSLAVNCNDDMMLGCSHSSSSMYIEAAFTYRLAGDALGTTRALQTLKAGEDSYAKDVGTGTVRWGDYSATCVDPVNDRCMWTIQEYARTDVGPLTIDDRWGTWWGSLCAPAPCVGDLDGDGDTDVFDFAIFAPHFAMSGFPPFTNGDFDGDGDVDVFDFAIFAPNFSCVP